MRQCRENRPHTAIYSYPSSVIDYVDYTYQQLDAFAFRVAQQYALLIPSRRSSADPEIVVGLLGPSNLSYFITMLALSKLGHTVLLLSTRISQAAHVSLLQTTGAKYLLIDPSFEGLAKSVQETLTYLQFYLISARALFDYEVEPGLDTRLDQALDPKQETNKTAWIIHSSGSTGLPKPIYQTHRAALNNYQESLNMRGFITLPLYHAHGVSSVFRAIISGKHIHVYNASLPLTQQYIIGTMRKHNFEIFYGVPYALKLLGETMEGIEILTRLKVVMFGGSACPDVLGQKLVDNGVNLISHYGTTETGQLMSSSRPSGDIAWDYVRPSTKLQPYLRWEERYPGIFELCVLDGWPAKVASNKPDGSYATKDLFTQHPAIPNAWKYYARMDDTIVLMNGEKANPLATEGAVREHANIAEAVVFGTGKARLGMMIVPSAATSGLSSDEIVDSIWPVVTAANSVVPGYAMLSRDMIKVLPCGTEYPRTDKGTVIRQAFYKQFAKQIDESYEEITSSEALSLSEAELRAYIRASLIPLLELKDPSALTDDTDFFSMGMDSLQTTRLRATLVRNIHVNGNKLGQNIVFEYPSINDLAKALFDLITGVSSGAVSIEEDMRLLIAKYGRFEPHLPAQNDPEGQYRLVTGATGSLGAHLVAQLALSDSVRKIYCPVRATSIDKARIRILKSMRERQVHHTLSMEARRKIIALPSDISKETLGLDVEVYEQIADDVTAIIHCAWSVNFNLGLRSFEKDCIAGVKNLITLCLKSRRPTPASFNFCSSVSAVAATKGGIVPESLPVELSYAQGMGYAQSKLVTEHICALATEQTGIRARVLRVGQVVADTVHGIWNDNEAIPMMLQAATTIGAVPKLDESPRWLPVDVVARIVKEISLSDAESGVMNVVNHQSFHWTRDFIPACHKAGLQFEEVGRREWIDRLRRSNPDPKVNPPIKLLDFFASKYDNDKPTTSLGYDTDLARKWSPALAQATVLDQSLVDKLIRYWMVECWRVSGNTQPQSQAIVIAGPCGAGKSTVARTVSDHFGVPWIEGDNLHSEASLAKMAEGSALLDEDRAEWFERIKEIVNESFATQEKKFVVVTCSALKHAHRERLRYIGGNVRTTFIMLQASRDTLMSRVGGREGHYMKVDMVDGQIAITEAPGIAETDVLPVDVEVSKETLLKDVVELVSSIS
ncbi:hypothetical protein B0A49_00047 [Cryomyces minteri]|uniref:gluconokinase n=1 Tax=Cryomyces minteri TaxID=331657 RepID=A0A4U0Y258_9PEZI|nr:hypothetical protein B0A49_00047 [Cryomyces minteri]